MHVARSYDVGADHQKARPYQKPSCRLTTACSPRIIMKGLAEGGVHVECHDSLAVTYWHAMPATYLGQTFHDDYRPAGCC